MLQIQLDLSYEVKRVRIEPPFEDSLAITHCTLRDEFQFDWRVEQIASMDARTYIPCGSAVALESDELIHVIASYQVRGWH